MTPAVPRPRRTWLQRVTALLLPLFLIFNLLTLAGAVRDARPVQQWWAQQTGLPVYLPGRGIFESLDWASGSPDGRWVAAGGTREDGESFTFRLALWDAETMTRRWTTDRPTDDFRSVNALRWSPDSRSVWTHDTEGRVTVLEAGTGRVSREFQAHQYQPCVFEAVPGGLLLTERANRDASTTLTLRRWQDGQVQWRVPFTCWWEGGSSVDVAGTTLAYSPRAGEVALYDLRRRAPLPLRLGFSEEHGPYSLALTPDGSGVAAGWGEGTLITWAAASGQETWRVRPHRGLIRALAWNPSGTALASSAFEGCGGWRSECVVVTRPGPGGPRSRVAWWRRFRAAQTVQWVGGDRLLIAGSREVRTVRVPQ